jgi:hypothetical protein
MFEDLMSQALDSAADKIDTWEKWIERYQRWMQIREFVERLNTTAHVVTARLCAEGTIDLDDPYGDRFEQRIRPPVFADLELENFVASSLPATPVAGSSRSVMNFSSGRAFDAVMQLSTERGGRLAGLAHLKLKRWEKLRDLPLGHDLLDAPLDDLLTSELADSELQALHERRIGTLGDLTSAASSSASDEAELRMIGARLFDQRATRGGGRVEQVRPTSPNA